MDNLENPTMLGNKMYNVSMICDTIFESNNGRIGKP